MTLGSWINRHADARDHGPTVVGAVKAAIVVGMLGLTGCVGLAKYARAHEATNGGGQPMGWTYPFSCCSNQDCRPARPGEVRETVDGYRLTSTGETVPYGDRRVKDAPDGAFHVCQQGGDFDHGRVLCLFVPGRGS